MSNKLILLARPTVSTLQTSEFTYLCTQQLINTQTIAAYDFKNVSSNSRRIKISKIPKSHDSIIRSKNSPFPS